MLGAGNDVGQLGKHLASVAHAQTKSVLACEKVLKLSRQQRVEGDAAGPADACTQCVAITETTACHQAFEIGQVGTTGLQVGHVHIVRFKTSSVERVGHLDMRVHPLLSKDGDFGAREIQKGRSHIDCRIKTERHMQARIVCTASGGVFGISARRVVPLLANLPAYAVPNLVQVFQLGCKNFFGVAPNAQLANAFGDGGVRRPGLANDVGVFGQTMLTQGLQHRIAIGGAHLQDHAQLFVEQGFEGELVSSGTDLARPVFGIAMVGSAVGDAVPFGHQHVHIEGHADVAGKGHFRHRRQQAAVAAVVVGQNLTLRAQLVDGLDQTNQGLGVFQIGHAVTKLAPCLSQDAAAHAVAALAQIHQQQAGVVCLCIQLGREGAAHIWQSGKSGDDQTHRRRHLAGFVAHRPLRTHRQTVFAHGNGNVQSGAQGHAHGFDGVEQGGIFAGFTTSGHPVGRQFDAWQLDGSGQQVGDGFGHRHATGSRRIQRGQRRALAQAHGFSCEAGVIGQGHRHIGHRHLPGPHHLVTVREATHGAVANGDQKPFGSHRGVTQHIDHGLL